MALAHLNPDTPATVLHDLLNYALLPTRGDIAGLKPHLVRGFKVSLEPKFVEKLDDIVGLYLSPPEHALILCCDEKSQVQALDRT